MKLKNSGSFYFYDSYKNELDYIPLYYYDQSLNKKKKGLHYFRKLTIYLNIQNELKVFLIYSATTKLNKYI